jgi:glycosyltransferase involved in cell wall biosynthesis
MRPQGGDLILIDVTRLIWRAWRGRHPTGIDRVCLAYLEHFQRRASAVIHRKGLSLILPQARSQRLFDLLLQGRRIPKASLILVLARALLEAHISPPERGMFYLNVGHTGLNDRAFPEWISRKRIRAIHLIHDLIPITNPEFCRPGEAERHEVRLTNALLSASGIIANSKATLTELAAFAARKSISMPPSVVAWISGFETLRRPPAKTLDQPYFIAIGTIEARKNHLVLLQAWQRLVRKSGERAPMLVIVGQPGWEAEQVLAWLENLGELEGKVAVTPSLRPGSPEPGPSSCHPSPKDSGFRSSRRWHWGHRFWPATCQHFVRSREIFQPIFHRATCMHGNRSSRPSPVPIPNESVS